MNMKRAVFFTILLLLLISARMTGQIETATVSASDNFNVGSVLTGGYTGSLPGGDKVEYEWFYADNTLIGTGETYTIDSDDQGIQIYLKVSEYVTAGHVFVKSVSTSPGTKVNSFPVARYVSVTGIPRSGMTLTGSYEYSDADNDTEASTFKWYTATDIDGTGSSEISGTNSISYTLTDSESGLYIGFEVTPKASSGSTPGIAVNATWIGPVTANLAPVASGQALLGDLIIGRYLYAVYNYSDPESDAENKPATEFTWAKANDGSGAGESSISNSSGSYQIDPADEGKFLKAGIIPHALTGTNVGAQVQTVWYGPVNSYPVATINSLDGTPVAGQILTANYSFSDVNGDTQSGSVISWYKADNGSGLNETAISGASGLTYLLKPSDTAKYIRFKVIPASLTGSSPGAVKTSSYVGPVTGHQPVASNVSISGSGDMYVDDVLTGIYNYSDADGDAEYLSAFEWWNSPDPQILNATKISGASGISYKIALSDTGKYIFFKVTPKAKTGILSGSQVVSSAVGSVNTPPYVTSVTISGSAIVNSTLTGDYDYHDGDNDPEGASKFRWLRNGTNVIPGATNITYKLTRDDEDYKITFEVTPVSSDGYPNTGTAVKSAETSRVDDPGSKPEAKDVCIEGKMAKNETLTGKYYYSFYKDEGTSLYQWYKNGVPISSANGTHYTLQPSDVDQDITFEVTPVSNNNPPKTGDAVMSNPLAKITLQKDSFYVTDKDTTLTAVPTGGVFFGEGVVNGKFSPSLVNVAHSPDTIGYQLIINNTNNTCQQIGTKILTITSSTMDFLGFNNLYCQNGGLDTISVKNIPAGYTPRFEITDPKGIEEQIDGSTIVINPGKMRAGNKEDTLYFFADTIGRNLRIFRAFVIDSIAQVSIMNLSPGEICENIDPYPLYVSQPGGAFEGPVENGIFKPSLHLGDTLVKYTYTTKLGCVSSVTVNIRINAAPDVSFSPKDSCIESSTDKTYFNNKTSFSNPLFADTIKNWLWEFSSDAGGTDTSTLKEPVYLYKTGGSHKVALSATTIKNCFARSVTFINLGVKPVADFYWKNECYHPADLLKLYDSTYSPSLIVSRTWNFFDGDSLRTVKNPEYIKKNPGYLPVEYIVKTNYQGCHDTVFKKIYIRPTKSLATDDYFENFESGNGGWVKDYEVRNSWSFGKPDRITIKYAASGDSAWFTNYSLTNQKVESSSIISPCFDFSSIQRPMISLKLWKRFDWNRDGAALQYKIGDSDLWQHVGTLEDGINWYNSTLIKGRPGGEQTGWTTGAGKDENWVESRHKLDELVGNQDVKFRIVYGSDGTSQDNDGIAFDDIRIGSRTRGVLLEHFTNNSSTSSSTATALISDLSNRETEDIINIQYHTNFPGSDPYYEDNPGDAGARFLFYGLSRAPYAFIDGGTRKDYSNIFDFFSADLDSNDLRNDLIKRSLMAPSFSVTLNSAVSGGILSITGQIKALQKIDSANVTLYLAVTERKNSDHTGALGETEFYNVFRKFIPDAGGISLNKTWIKDETYTLTEKSWIIEKIPNSSDIEVIAFLQNNITKEVYQAVSNVENDIVVGIDNLFINNGKGFSIYPNPSGNHLTVVFEKIIEKEADIRIYDFSGALIRTYKAGSGQTEFTINNLGLANGIYLLRVSSGGLDWGYKKLIVSKN